MHVNDRCHKCNGRDVGGNGFFWSDLFQSRKWVCTPCRDSEEWKRQIERTWVRREEKKYEAKKAPEWREAIARQPKPTPRQAARPRKSAKWRDIRRGAVSQPNRPKIGALWAKLGHPERE